MSSSPLATDKAGEVLIVDDSPASLRLLSLWLEEAGYAVRQAPSGELALWSLQSRHPDLILLDVRMPVMDGFETCRRLKADGRVSDIPVIFLSAENETTDRIHGLQIGGVDFIAKNFAREEVLARVKTHVTLARVQRALLEERASLEQRVRERTAEIEQHKTLLQQVIDSFPDWIYVKDREHRLRLVNRIMAQDNRLLPSEMIGRIDREAAIQLPQVDDEEESVRWQRYHDEDDAAHAGRAQRLEAREWSPQHGEIRHYEIFKGPLYDASEQINGILCYRRDITEKLKNEAERKHFEEQLWRSQKMQALGQLTGGIAHDFNNILATILGFSEFARTALAAGRGEKLDYYLSEVQQAGLLAKELVAQLLSFSRSEETGAESLALPPALQEVTRLLQATLGDGMQIKLETEAVLPPVRLRAIHLHQIMMNLGINARDACTGRGTLRIEATCAQLPLSHSCASCHADFQGDFVRLSLADNGPGIAPEHLPNIFDPFFTTKEIGQGTGLGLSVIHGIVHAAGGHLQVGTSPTGSRFDVFLPVHAQHPTAPAKRALEETGGPGPSARLLVVDDESSIVAFIRELFEFSGCRVMGLTDPLEALETFLSAPQNIDLAILDESMPSLSGSELAAQLRRLRPELPIILCSGLGQATGQGLADRFLTKPVSCQDLRDAVRDLLAAST